MRIVPSLRLSILVFLVAGGVAGRAQFVITEFMAVNNTTLNDEDGENADWIEIHNEGTTVASLQGWHLTDTTNNLTKWTFPATNLPPNGYLVVFASEKNRRTPGAPLHTNFRLGGDGEYLALIRPDGVTAATAFRPLYPAQVADVSFGIVRDTAQMPLLAAGAPVKAWVPTTSDLGTDWTAVEFDDSTWTNGTSGVGYDRQILGVNFLPLIGLNVEAMMYNLNQSVYLRVPFTVNNPAELIGLNLRLRFEDGMVAYLNGQEIARSNAPVTATWNSGALGPRTDTAATNALDFDVSEFRSALQVGINVLAFHGLNNPVASPDFLLLPELIGLTPNGSPQARYFAMPSPGRANSGGVATLGPIVSAETHSPSLPADGDNLVVTARIRPSFAAVGSVTLRYRVMFGGEISLPLLDDGLSGDGAAGDGIYGATIPASASTGGQMVRWYFNATDTTGTNTSRYPAFSGADSPAYFGTVIQNPAVTSPLPVFHWFVQNVSATDTTAGTRCSVFYNGEFYDNVFCRVRGASAPSFPKKPYKFDFNPGDHFRFRPGAPRVDEINLNSTQQDKAHVRAPLVFETYGAAGVPASEAFNVRIQQNNAFFSVAAMIEQVDDTFMERRGLDPEGALYKMFNGINSASSGVEKKTRRTENNADLQQLVSAVSLSNPNRARDIFDLINLPEMINYLAVGTVVQDWDRAVKNIYLYRDSNGTGLWQMWPWDKDLSLGKVGLQNDALTATRDSNTGLTGGGEPYLSHPFYGIVEANCCGANNLMEAIYKTPVTREMYLRRLRTLMDEFLQPPSTPAAQLKYEARLDELFPQLQNDAALDSAKWGANYGVVQTLATTFAALRTNYLAPRRVHLYQTHNVDNVGIYPLAVGIPHAQAGSPAVLFGAIEFNPGSGRQGEEYVELVNPNPIAVDISGWRVESGIEFTFVPGTVLPANGRAYLSPDIASFRNRASGPRGGQGLFVLGNYRGQLSARGEALRLLNADALQVASTNYPGAPSPAQRFLRITEIMYHPPANGGNTNAAEEFEFIELRNVSSAITVNLAGVRFINGIEFNFTGSAVTSLAPGASVVVVRNAAEFIARYGGAQPVAGVYSGSLENNGERLQLIDASGEEIHDFSYDDDWHPITDGLGFSLVVVDEQADSGLWSNAAHWRASGTLNGSPGQPNPVAPSIAPIRVNEVLSHTDTPPPFDSVELFNPTATSVDLGGWFLSDDFNSPKKFRIPAGTTIAPGAFVVFTEEQFNAGGLGFAFSSLGDEAWLFSGDAQSNLSGYFHGFRFGASENNVSFGRHLNSVGAEHLVPQTAVTLGTVNAGPRVGPVILSEVMYHPAGEGEDSAAGSMFEYIELQNIAANTVPLYDPLHPTNTWRLRGGIDFDFPSNVLLPPSGVLLVVGFDPVADPGTLASFRAAYALSPSVTVLGPWQGRLDNAGDRITLQRPDSPVPNAVPFILLEALDYQDIPPWPWAADGAGSALQRRVVGRYGNEPTNWFAAGRSPGAANVFNLAPTVFITAPTAGTVFGPPANIPISVAVSDPDGSVTTVEFFSDGRRIGMDSESPFSFTWPNAPVGSHALVARAIDNRFASADSAPVEIVVLAQPPTVSIISPTNGAFGLASSVIALTAAASDPDGFITTVEFLSGGTKLGEVSTSPYVFSWSNAVPGSYSLTAVATDNAGFTAVSAPVSFTVVAGFATNLTLIPTGSIWKYFDQGLDQGTSWRGGTFNDGTWSSGPGPLGYGDGDEATVVNSGPVGSAHVTTYFRRAFSLADAAAFSALTVRVLRDDGAVVYLNGLEAFRTGMPEGAVLFNTLANVTAVGTDESSNYYEASVNPALLQDGVNVMAVEIHQVQTSSSDISFDLALSGTQTFYAPTILQQPSNASAAVGSNATLAVIAGGTGPLFYQWRRNGINLAGANQSIYSIDPVTLTSGGAYSVIISNRAGVVTSREALVAVIVPNDYAQTLAVDGPIHYYRFEETATTQPAVDLGNPGGMNGVYSGSVSVNQATSPLRTGRAVGLDGNAGGFVALSAFHPGNSITVEAWIRLAADARAGSYHAIVARWDGSFELDIAPDERANFVVRNQVNAFGLVATPGPLARGVWHHLAASYDAGVLSIHWNGALAGTAMLAGTLRNGGPSPDRVLIGGTRDGSNSSFNWRGEIDEVAVYNRALGADRIFAHYQAGLPLPVLSIGRPGIVSWPAYPADVILQVTDSLGEPFGWRSDNSVRQEENGFFRITVPFTGTNRFYRLYKP